MIQYYDYQKNLKSLWGFALERYRSGDRNPAGYFDRSQTHFMDAVGLKPMDIYDYVEDFATSQEPDFETFLLVCDVRKDYFEVIQAGRFSDAVIDPSTLPSKEASVDGIVWLPRILPKARAKIKGELPTEIMYGCGGDRRFFRENNVHPAEFLRRVWAAGNDDSRVIDWVKTRRAAIA